MKKLITLLFICAFVVSFAQDKIHLHGGKVIDGKVIKLEDFKLIFKYAGEDAEQTLTKKAVEKIVYSSGRTEEVSERIVVSSKEDWEKVEILLDKSEIVGLKKVGEVKGKTMGYFSGYVSGAAADKKANKKMLEVAAEMGCPFVYMTSDSGNSGAFTYGKQALKKGIGYTYDDK
jgi:hypothetical protein